jgi:hypothetical protein
MLIAAALAANAFAQTPERTDAATQVAPFSSAKPGTSLPPGWGPFIIAAGKRHTEYRLVEDQGQTVLNAKAEGAASALSSPVKLDIRAAPMLEWRWKVAGLIEGADNSVASKEDSPARVVLGFDGDRSKFTVLERASASVSKSANNRELPVSQLIYIWSNHAPVGTIIPNPRTKRVQMVVASSGAAGVGKWQTLSRNVLEDFRRAFGEEPGMLTDVGVLTDTDNTQGTAEAWYGDIRFLPAR